MHPGPYPASRLCLPPPLVPGAAHATDPVRQARDRTDAPIPVVAQPFHRLQRLPGVAPDDHGPVPHAAWMDPRRSRAPMKSQASGPLLHGRAGRRLVVQVVVPLHLVLLANPLLLRPRVVPAVVVEPVVLPVEQPAQVVLAVLVRVVM